MKYHPIACHLYDILEHFATLRQKVVLVFQDEQGERLEKQVLIVDIRKTGDGEYLFTDDLELPPVRLDRIRSIAGQDFTGTC